MKLYSYNQLVSLYGKDDLQVIKIYKFISIIGDCVTNRDLEAFRRVI